MANAVYVFEVDWDNDGDFGDTSEDCTADLISVETRRGRDYASQLTGRASTGRLAATLKNTAGTYSSYYSSSPIYGSILPGRMVRLRTTSPSAVILWTGYLEKILPAGSVDGIPVVTLEASGAFVKIAGKKVYPAKQSAETTGTIIDVILDAASWNAGYRTLDTGQTEIDKWFVDDRDALNAIREIEETELGFVYEGENGYIVFEDRHHRLKSPHTASVATYSDVEAAAKGYRVIEQLDPLQDIYNDVTAEVNSYTVAGAPAVLWTLNETPTLAPGESKSYWAQYPNTAVDSTDGAYVDSWETPVVGTDITQTGVDNGDIDVSTSKFANSMKITITNNDATGTATLTLVQAQGTKVTKNEPVRINAEDTTSQGKYGNRSYRLPAEWLGDSNTAQDYTNYVVSRYKDPVPVLRITYIANKNSTMLGEALARNISDRITIVATEAKTMLGIDRDFFIEAITHRITRAGRVHEVSYDLSDASGDGSYWVLGLSELSISTKLAY